MSQPPYTANPRRQKEVDAAEQRRHNVAVEQERDDMRWLMGQQQGRRVVWRFLTAGTGYLLPNGEPADCWSPVAMELAGAHKRRRVGEVLWAFVWALCPDHVRLMVQENGNGGDSPQSN